MAAVNVQNPFGVEHQDNSIGCQKGLAAVGRHACNEGVTGLGKEAQLVESNSLSMCCQSAHGLQSALVSSIGCVRGRHLCRRIPLRYGCHYNEFAFGIVVHVHKGALLVVAPARAIGKLD